MAAAALLSFAGPMVGLAHASTPPTTAPAGPGFSTQGSDRITFEFYVTLGAKINVYRKWDHWNNCVEMDGTEYRDYEPPGTTVGGKGYGIVQMSVTAYDDGSCRAERHRMHWDVDFPGRKHGAANISIKQLIFFGDYYSECEGVFAEVHCDYIRDSVGRVVPYVH